MRRRNLAPCYAAPSPTLLTFRGVGALKGSPLTDHLFAEVVSQLDGIGALHVLCGLEAVPIKNITLALDEETIKAGREYAKRHNLTLNSLVRKLLHQTVSKGSSDWIDEAFALMDKAVVAPRNVSWKRKDLYRA